MADLFPYVIDNITIGSDLGIKIKRLASEHDRTDAQIVGALLSGAVAGIESGWLKLDPISVSPIREVPDGR